MRHSYLLIALALLCMRSAEAADDIPRLIPYQGWVQVDGRNHDGPGSFKFAIVSADGATSYWSHDGSSSGGGEPSGSISLTVTNGLFAVQLGDTAISGMAAIPLDVFDNADAHLAVWFDDGSNGFAMLGSLQRLAASPFAFRAQEAQAVNSDSVASGLVLTADGSGGSNWQAPSGGGSGLAAGTTSGNTLRWNGSAWVEEDDLAVDTSGNVSSNGSLTIAGRFAGGQSTLVGDANPETALDLSGLTSLKVDTATNAETIQGFTGGIPGQEVKIFNAGTNSLTFTHSASSGNQDILAPAADDVVLGAYGGVTLICDGSAWYVIERAATYED